MSIEWIILFVVVPALLATAAGWDLASYMIPNFLPLALLAAFVVLIPTAAMTPGMIGMHVLAGAIGLAVGFAMFALGYIGGGDAKLFAVVVLWLGFGNLFDYALTASLFGGALALVLLSLRRLPLPAVLLGQGWILRLHDRRSGIPYGVALAAGALVILPHAEIFRLAAG